MLNYVCLGEFFLQVQCLVSGLLVTSTGFRGGTLDFRYRSPSSVVTEDLHHTDDARQLHGPPPTIPQKPNSASDVNPKCLDSAAAFRHAASTANTTTPTIIKVVLSARMNPFGNDTMLRCECYSCSCCLCARPKRAWTSPDLISTSLVRKNPSSPVFSRTPWLQYPGWAAH